MRPRLECGLSGGVQYMRPTKCWAAAVHPRTQGCMQCCTVPPRFGSYTDQSGHGRLVVTRLEARRCLHP
jgi:hypothetical protein